jgi:glycogen(starch) synthase
VRVQYWSELFPPYIGGSQVLDSQLLPAMRRRGYEFQVVTDHGPRDLLDSEDWEGIPVHRFRFRKALASGEPARIFEAQQEVAELKRGFQPDLVHVNVSDPIGFFHLRSERWHTCPLVVTVVVAPGPSGGHGTVLGRLLASAAWVTASSEVIRGDLVRLAPDVEERSSVIRHTVEAPAIEPAPLRFDRPLVLGLGRLVREKGFDVALTAFARVAHTRPSAHFMIAGDGPERPRLEKQAVELGLDGRIAFPGWISPLRVHELINTATVVVMPSRWREAFGIVALQAAQIGRPVVATCVGGLPEIVADGMTGLLVDNEDAAALGDAIGSLLADPALAVRMGEAARVRAFEQFGFEPQLDALDRLYRRLAS